MKILLLFVLGFTILDASAQDDRLGLTQDEFENVFVRSTEYTKLMDRLHDLETNEGSLTQKINSYVYT